MELVPLSVLVPLLGPVFVPLLALAPLLESPLPAAKVEAFPLAAAPVPLSGVAVVAAPAVLALSLALCFPAGESAPDAADSPCAVLPALVCPVSAPPFVPAASSPA